MMLLLLMLQSFATMAMSAEKFQQLSSYMPFYFRRTGKHITIMLVVFSLNWEVTGCAAVISCFYLIGIKLLAFFFDCTGQFVSNMVRNPKDWFSRAVAHLALQRKVNVSNNSPAKQNDMAWIQTICRNEERIS